MAHSWQIVDSIVASPTVLLDLDNNSPLSVQEGTDVSPPKLRRTTSASLGDGDVESRASYMDRVVKLSLNIKAGTSAESQASTLQTLARLLDRREGVWIKWHSEGMTQPLFFHTRRADYEVLDAVLDATPIRGVRLEIPCEPFAYGLPETGSFTVTNDPTAGTNKMAVKWATAVGAVKGDVLTPLTLKFPALDGGHRIVVASASLVDGDPTQLALDYYDRADSTTVLGTPNLGAAWSVVSPAVAGISSNQAYFSTAGGASAWSVATTDTGRADGIVEVTIGVMAANGFTGLVVRNGGNATTGWGLMYNQMYNVGNNATQGAAFSQTFATGDRMRVVMSGNTITVYRQAGAVGTWVQVMTTTTPGTYNTNTKHGLTLFGTSAGASRWDDFSFASLTGELLATPYWRPFTAEAIKTPAVTDWTISDVADAQGITGTVRRMNHTADTVSNDTERPFLASLSRWPGIPRGEYMGWVRIAAATASGQSIKLLNGTTVPAATADVTELLRGYLPLGSVPIAFPYGASPTDIVYDSEPLLKAAPYSYQVQMYQAGGVVDTGYTDLDGTILIPTTRPGLIARFLQFSLPTTHTGRYVTVDGINTEQVSAVGRTAAAPLIDQIIYPLEQAGGPPVLVPGADNVLYFIANTDDPRATGTADLKATTTVIQWTYLPRYLSAVRPSAS